MEDVKKELKKHEMENIKSFDMIASSLFNINSNLNNHIEDFNNQKVLQDKMREEMKAEYMEVKLALANQNKDMKPIIDTFGNLKWGERVLIRVGIFLGGLVTFSIGLVELIKLITNFKK